MCPCLVLESVSREFGGLKAVDAVDLAIRSGERHAVIGPNGAGKTTLFNLISGELQATGGKIVFFGADVTPLPPHQRAARGIARTFQVTRLFPGLSVLDNVLLACAALDRRRFTMYRPLASCTALIDRATELLDAFGLSQRRLEPCRILSYGEQRKLEVALSLAGRPRLLLLDEPMAGLSSDERSAVLSLLEQLDPSIAVLLIEHDMDIALAFAETITVLHQGRVVASGRKNEVSANPIVQEVYLGVQAAPRPSPPPC